MKNTVYNQAKQELLGFAKEIKKDKGNDSPFVRTALNDKTDSLLRNINHEAMRGTITEKQAALYCNWLSSLCCALHP